MMPKVIGNDSLIARVNEVQGYMYRQSNELGRLNRAVKKYKDENAKLRKLVRDMMEFFEDGDWCVKCERARDCQAQEQYEDECLMRFVFRDRMCELGVEA